MMNDTMHDFGAKTNGFKKFDIFTKEVKKDKAYED